MSRSQEITEARILLGLPERASMAEIKAKYHELLNQWHPDKCSGDPAECNEMTRQINAAYTILMRYCSQYKYSFAPEELDRYRSEQEWWTDRFGADPVWGKR
jgi:DnaJ-class molecular chaperone